MKTNQPPKPERRCGTWISVKDALPPKHKPVIGYDAEYDNMKFVARYGDKENQIWQSWADNTRTGRISHWMPLPDKPEEV